MRLVDIARIVTNRPLGAFWLLSGGTPLLRCSVVEQSSGNLDDPVVIEITGSREQHVTRMIVIVDKPVKGARVEGLHTVGGSKNRCANGVVAPH